MKQFGPNFRHRWTIKYEKTWRSQFLPIVFGFRKKGVDSVEIWEFLLSPSSNTASTDWAAK